MGNILFNWLKARLSEASTYAGIGSALTAVGVHITLPGNDLATVYSIIAAIVGGALTAATTSKPVIPAVEQAVVSEAPAIIGVVANAVSQPAASKLRKPQG